MAYFVITSITSPLFPGKSTVSQNNLHFWLKLSFIDHAANIFGSRSVSQALLSKKINFFLWFCDIHGTYVPQKVTEDFSTILNACAKLGQLPKMASACVVNRLTLQSFQKMNYILLKFLLLVLDFSSVCLPFIVEAQFMYFLLKWA